MFFNSSYKKIIANFNKIYLDKKDYGYNRNNDVQRVKNIKFYNNAKNKKRYYKKEIKREQKSSSFLVNYFYLYDILIGITIYFVIYLLIILSGEATNLSQKLFYPVDIKVFPKDISIILWSWIGTSIILIGIVELFLSSLPANIKIIVYYIVNIFMWYQPSIWIYRFIINPPDSWITIIVMVVGYFFLWINIFERSLWYIVH
ncbi:MAG: hypothetical protein QME35_02995 [Thermoanaerobacteraceae bacterium]|nr:hypothetical protein [Thermoanaerobacteraceae bacterium]